MNLARHDLEGRISDEISKSRALEETNKRREDLILTKENEIEDLDKKILDKDRQLEAIEVKSNSMQRQFDLAKKQLNEKMESLNANLESEKQMRDMWVERFETE